MFALFSVQYIYAEGLARLGASLAAKIPNGKDTNKIGITEIICVTKVIIPKKYSTFASCLKRHWRDFPHRLNHFCNNIMGIIAKQSIKGALANYLGVLIGAVTTFFVVTDLLTQEEIGLTRVMVDAAMLFAGLAQLGTNASILRFYPRFRTAENPGLRDHGFFGWTLILPFLGFTLLAVLFFLFKDNIVAYYADDAPLLVDYAYLLLPLTFFVLYMTVFETNASVLLHIALPKFVREVVIRVLNLTAYLLYGYRIISLDLFVILFCSSYAVAMLINFFYLLSLGRISFRPDWHFVSRSLFREVGVYTLFMTATVLAGNIKLFNSIFIARQSLAAAGIYTIASYTYGPLLGLFAFSLFTKRMPHDRLVPYICIASPIACYALDAATQALWGYRFGYELLIINGLLTFGGLWISRKC